MISRKNCTATKTFLAAILAQILTMINSDYLFVAGIVIFTTFSSTFASVAILRYVNFIEKYPVVHPGPTLLHFEKSGLQNLSWESVVEENLIHGYVLEKNESEIGPEVMIDLVSLGPMIRFMSWCISAAYHARICNEELTSKLLYSRGRASRILVMIKHILRCIFMHAIVSVMTSLFLVKFTNQKSIIKIVEMDVFLTYSCFCYWILLASILTEEIFEIFGHTLWLLQLAIHCIIDRESILDFALHSILPGFGLRSLALTVVSQERPTLEIAVFPKKWIYASYVMTGTVHLFLACYAKEVTKPKSYCSRQLIRIKEDLVSVEAPDI